MVIATTNPATGEVVRTFAPLSPAEVDRRLDAACAGYKDLRRTSLEQRAQWLRAAADLLHAENDSISSVMTLEMGKTLIAAQAEVKKCAAACRFFADHGAGFLGDKPLADPSTVGATRALTRYRPIGPVLAIMPWNYPMWQAMRFAAPALMAGNVGLLKHASNVPQTALYLEDLFFKAGFPPGAFQTLLIGSDQVESVLTDDRVVAATLTGSEAAGRSVAAIAGQSLKKTVLELGGSDPFIVMPSADLATAARIAATARCQNNGQSCIAAKRFIVHSAVYEEFGALFVEAMNALTVGNPFDESTDVGPLATEQGRATVEEQVADAVAHGAEVLCGGERPQTAGWYYPPTVIAEIQPGTRLWSEEVFGPVAGLFRVDSYDKAIEIANGTDLGLGSNAWTTDRNEQERFMEDLDAGMVFINGMTTSYPELPFGGVKKSGYGRELAAQGIHEFCNLTTIWVGGGENTGEEATAKAHNE